jgi:DNA-directed RNA polymerase
MESVLSSGPLFEEELRLEREARSEGIARYRKDVEDATKRGEGSKLTAVDRLLVHWFTPLRHMIAAEKRACSMGRPGVNRREIGPVLKRFTTARLAITTMHEVLSLLLREPRGVTPTKLSLAIARALNAQENYRLLREQHLAGIKESDHPVRYGHPAWAMLVHTSRRKITVQATNRVAARFSPSARWPIQIQLKTGACLLHLFSKVATVGDLDKPFEDAFMRLKIFTGGHAKWHWRLSDAAMAAINEGHLYRQALAPVHYPMCVQPLRWTESDHGGYLTLPVSVVKRNAKFQENPEVREALNAVNSMPWRINRWVLDVMQEIADSGGNAALVPMLDWRVEYPPKPDDYHANPEVKKKWKRLAQEVYHQNITRMAEAHVFHLMLDSARRMRDFDQIYFPQQLDFRGRQYPVPSHLNHHGSDLHRGLLELGESRPFGHDVRALNWLKVQLADACGHDHCTFEERVRWVDETEKEWLYWAQAPLKCTGWMLAEDPWQALAAAHALCCDDASTHFPGGIDGTNNALQHYAAMTRDENAAEMVNLKPGDSPEDFYGHVAGATDNIIDRDAETGTENARMLQGLVNRKICKATAMTNYYGVTAVGARRQMYTSLKKLGFDKDSLYSASSYLSKVVLRATVETCPAVQEVLVWLRHCCREVIQRTGKTVVWTSPIGMTVEQPYRNAKQYRTRTPFHELYCNRVDATCPPKLVRQINAFPPNFVHSIDASHVMAAAIACKDCGIRFASVHDRVITHVADLDRLAEIVRQHFYLIHEEPRLVVLHDELQTRYGIELPPPPPMGYFDIAEVLESKYLFA